MIRAAAFLIACGIKNRFTRTLSRLRQPRYLLGLAAAGVYFWSFFLRHRAALQIGAAPPPGFSFLFITAISILVLVIMVLPWAFSGREPGLVFSEAEIQFFFPGPLSRRQLLAYKVLRSQMQIFFTTIIFRLFAFRGGHLLGLWLAFAVLDVYFTFVSFVRARMHLGGFPWWPRALAVAGAFAGIIAVGARQIEANAPAIMLDLKQGGGRGLGTLVRTLGAAPLSRILYVPRLFGELVYGATPLIPALILLMAAAALFFVTTQLDVSFEDASIVASQRALSRRARMRGIRSGRSTTAVNRMRPLFPLGERGRPEVALIWKNLIGAMRLTSMPLFAIAIPLFLAAFAGIFHRREGIPELLGIMGLMSTGMLVFLGPRAVRTDLRADILRLDLIKTFPLSAESLIIGELGASLLIVSVFEILLLVTSVTLLAFFSGREYFARFTTPEFVVSALVFIIPVTAIQLLIQNGAIILFPAWSVTGDDFNRFSAMGQRLLMLIGNVVTLGVALLPAAILFLPSLWLMLKLMGRVPFAILIATIPAAAVLVIEIFLAVKFLASQFEDIDIANDLDAVSA